MGKTLIREATYDDLDVLLLLARSMAEESPRYTRLRFSEDKMARLYISLINSPGSLLMVAERNGGVIGGMAATITPHWFSEDLVANDYGLFLLPEHRGGMTAAKMVRAYIEWAKAKGAKLVQLGISTGVQVEETAALYQALGLKQFSIGFEV